MPEHGNCKLISKYLKQDRPIYFLFQKTKQKKVGKWKKGKEKHYQKRICLANTPPWYVAIQRAMKKLDKWAGRAP